MKPLPGTVSAALAHFVADTRWDDLPDAVRAEARRSLLNYFAVALGGCRDPVIERADAALSPFTGAATATVVGRERRADLLHAASLNAMAANVFDFDDTHPETIIHPSAPVAEPLFALAEALLLDPGMRGIAPLSGPDLLLAFVLGVEVECRIGNAISPAHYARGWHITATCGVFGAAAAAAKALRLDAHAIHAALGNASALLARRGFGGPDEPLAGARGFLNVFGEAPRPAAITDGLGTDWQILRNTHKPYPCGVVLNPVIEACLALAAQHPLRADDITAIELTGAPLLRQRTDRPGVDNGRLAQVSAQHAAPVALLTGRAGIAQFSDAAVADPDTRALGGPARPMSDGELRDKLGRLIEHSGCAIAAQPLIAAIDALDRSEDAAGVMALLRPAPIG